jgi:hypothetical protein
MDTLPDPRAARLIRVLNSYRVLTHDSLAELCDVKTLGGPGAFEHALRDAVASGRIRRLSDSLYEVIEQPPE